MTALQNKIVYYCSIGFALGGLLRCFVLGLQDAMLPWILVLFLVILNDFWRSQALRLKEIQNQAVLALLRELDQARKDNPKTTIHQFLARHEFEYDQRNDKKPITGPPANE